MSEFYFPPYSNLNSALLCIKDFTSVIVMANIPYCFIMGTALGLYRDGNFIPNDNDIDVFIKLDKINKNRFIKSMTDKGFSFNLVPGAFPNHNYHFVKYHILLDIWFNLHKNFIPSFSNLDFVPFHQFAIPLPSNIESYLTSVFGNWKVPSNIKSNMFKGIPADQLHRK